MKEIAERLSRLRELMRREHLSAFIFSSTDPHNSEYVPQHWEGRKWMSGFTGSAGTAVVTLTSAAVWTDSRYFLAAADELSGTEYQLMKERMPGTPTIAQWLGHELADAPTTEVGVDGSCLSAEEVEALVTELRENGGLTLRTNLNPLAEIWTSRPPIPTSKVFVHQPRYAGVSAHDKLLALRSQLSLRHADGMLVCALDDIAWLLNLRGQDVHCTPVFVGYVLVSVDGATLFIDKAKLTPEVEQYLANEGVGVAPYTAVTEALRHYNDYNLLLDPAEVNYTLWRAAAQLRVVRAASPVPAMKAVKNEAEIEGFHHAMLRDGVALVRFLKWLKPAVQAGGETELSAAEKLRALRAEQPLFRDLSFDTIAAYAAHGAIVHYEPTAESDVPLRPEGLLLLDSGAQYLDGTTDITRTIALGPVTDEERKVYTLVLKGHLQLQNLCFPDGACGSQLDAVARMAMWHEGMNFMHGTGHGVGAYLNVHEGPHQIRMEWRPAPLHAGMTVTDEPGLYLAGRFGVRTENTLLVVPHRETEFGRFLRFEPLTLCPIDKAPIMPEMLSDDERAWLNAYHRHVYEALYPLLEPDEQKWLADACAPL